MATWAAKYFGYQALGSASGAIRVKKGVDAVGNARDRGRSEYSECPKLQKFWGAGPT